MGRIQNLQEALRNENIDSFILTNPTSIDYLIKHRFHPGERFLALLVFPNTQPVLLLNRLFPYTSTNNLVEIVSFEDGDDVIALLEEYCQGTVAVDDNLPAKVMLPMMEMKENHKVISNIVLGSKFVDQLRLIKDEGEQANMREASKCNDEIMKEVESFLRVGVSDIEVEQHIYEIHQRLGLRASFPPIVAFQKIASDPHGSANGQVLEEHDCVIIDMGIIKDGYCSDMTRTFLFGETKMREIYDIVLQANKAAIASIKPGIRFCDVDRAAREVIEQAGYGDYFTHRTGHGIGLDIHEPMDVSRVNEELLCAGMCFSIEPGIYLPEIGGVRIEDLIIVTKTGAEVLNSYPK